MNILYHFRTRGTGAEGVHISGIITAFRRLGHNVFVLSPNGVDPLQTKGENPFIHKGKMNIYSRISLGLPQVFFEILEILYNVAAFFLFLRILKNKKIDLIYERYAFFLLAGVLIARIKKIPIVVEVNEISGFERVRKQALVGLVRLFERYIFNNASIIVVVSQFLKTEIERLGVEGGKISVIPNGVDMSEINDSLEGYGKIKERHNIQDNSIVVGFVGWFVRWHRLDLLLDALAMTIQDGFKDIRLMLVGEGPLRAELERQVTKLNVENNLIFTDAVKHKDVFQYISVMDICVIPNSNEYRSPVKLFEYMACEKPVVVPDTPPISSVIRDEDNGVVFKIGDVESLKQRLLLLISDRGLRLKIGKRAKIDVINNYTWFHNAEKIMNLYNHAVVCGKD